MAFRPRQLIPLAFWIAFGRADGSPETSGAAGSGGSDQDGLTSQLLDWLRANGAYINEKLEVRSSVPDDPTSLRGVFATEDMDAGEIVCNIPWKLILKPNEGAYDARVLNCDTITEVAKAMDGGETTPYGRYLLNQPKNYVPLFWSNAAKELLSNMLQTDRPVENHVTELDELPRE